jgi:glutamate-ammonia-ligase adenylyltransferase
VALGKLGSLELNYASDIDLIFLYSEEGSTSGLGSRGEVTNREYFVKLSETIVKLVGQAGGEGAAYRVDLRLRPRGRDGALAVSLAEATRYYAREAQDWERQALIRSRSSAGSPELFARFKELVTPHVFRPEISVNAALASVRLAKQKIDRQVEKKSGFNVKLGRGGIREIEFIAQALQLAYGGNDDWLRVPHTLVSVGRLADRGFITEQERSELSESYGFLRTLEHRLQMEHGLQTHTVPESAQARALIARRMGFVRSEPEMELATAVRMHTSNVRRTYERLFTNDEQSIVLPGERDFRNRKRAERIVDKETALATAAAGVFRLHVNEPSLKGKSLDEFLRNAALDSLNPQRSLVQAARIAESLEKTDLQLSLSLDHLSVLMQLCGSSDFFGEMIASNPSLIASLVVKPSQVLRRDHRAILRAAIDAKSDFSSEMSVLRHRWAELIIEIGTLEATSQISVLDANRLQTELAVGSINVAYLIARREMARRLGPLKAGPRIAFLGLGRLGSGGVDYGSDLDLLICYDSLVPSPLSALTQDEAYARLSELMIAALSSITREGYLYRVDVRLRPHGKNGPLVTSSEAFLDYLRESSVAWEWLAYVKLRAVGGDIDLGKMIETHARHRIHANALKLDVNELQTETKRVRDRLEKEKGSHGRHSGTDIKYGPGGMLDVYFAARFLQLRDEVPDEGSDRSTRATLERLREEGSLGEDDFEAINSGYELLRSADHELRLISGRSTRLPKPDHPVARDVAVKLGYESAAELQRAVDQKMESIRESYKRIVE